MDDNKIIEMLGRGYSQTVVASACGCSDSYISQLVSAPEVREQLSALRLRYLERHVDQDDSIDDVEKQALKRVRDLLPMVTDPMKALRVFQVTNQAKRKTVAPETSNADKVGVVVQINLPASLAQEYKLSSDRQVVEVNGRSLATMPSNLLQGKLADRKAATPQISDATSAANLLDSVSRGVIQQPVRNIFEEAL